MKSKESETCEEAFDELIDAAYKGQLKKGSIQYKECRKMFYAGAIWLTDSMANHPELIPALLQEMVKFNDEIAVEAAVSEAFKKHEN